MLWNLAHKHVLLVKACHIGTQQFRVVWEGTAWLAFESEETKLLSDLVKLVWVLKFDHGSVEWLAWVTTDLWHMLEVVAGLLLDNFGKFGGGI